MLHTEDPVDWPQIAALYAELAGANRLAGRRAQPRRRARPDRRRPSGRSTSRTGWPPTSTGYPYLHSTRAELLRRLDRNDEARAAYRRALELTAEERERRFLRGRLAELERSG